MTRILAAILFLFLTSVATGADPFCPEAASIVPCYCSSTDGVPSVHCSFINDQDQLESIFSADFPVRDFDQFLLIDSQITTISRDVFGNSTFQTIILEGKYLETITADGLGGSVDTLKRVEVNMCPITTTSFPFAETAAYENIVEFRFNDNLLTAFPPLISNSAKIGFITNNYLQTVPTGALTSIPQIDSMSFNGNLIDTIQRGAFQGAELLVSLLLDNNKLTALTSGVLSNLPNLIYLTLSNNQISSIEEDVFEDLYNLKSLHLQYNNLGRVNVTMLDHNSNLEKFDVKFNQIENIEPGTFSGTPMINLIDFTGNNLTRLSAGAFDGVSKASIYLSQNQINYIEASAFGTIANSTVHLEVNQLTDLFEFWLSPLLENNNEVFVAGNPFTCGCEISWIFSDPSFQSLVYGMCPNGTYIADLNPDDYASCVKLQ